VSADEVDAFRWATFARRGHPAIRRWGRAAWERWPHVAVRVSLGIESPVATAAQSSRRRIAAWVPQFTAVAPLLARTDLIATLPRVAMVDELERYDLVALPPPIAIEPMRHRLLWSRRLDADPAIRWIRAQVRAALDAALARADAMRVRAR
jgi:DNA-binding transcriptional LysR family regulator